MRKNPLVIGETYHIFTRSIADFTVYNDNNERQRMQQLIKYYQVNNEVKFSNFMELKIVRQNGFNNTCDLLSKDKDNLVQILAYCLMPTHLHLVLKQLTEKGISKFLKDILDSYTRFFNNKHKRKGPLWESRFKSVLVETDEQLLHLTRYIHLNPVTAKLIDRPEDWFFSSYKEYLSQNNTVRICQFDDVLEIDPYYYRKFCNERISYQRELAKIKNLMMD